MLNDKRQMRVIRVIRMTPELKAIIDATAQRSGLTVCDVLRCVATGIRSGRPCCFVADAEKLKSATKSGAVVVNIEAGVTVPDMLSAYALRRAIYLRCMEELARPDKPRRRAPVAIEGVDYNVPDGIAAAKLGVV